MDEVFKALSDPSRRCLLDSLNDRNGQTLRELCAGLDMARQSVSKHLAILADANLVITVRRGREKLHYLNPAPISDIAERWINRYDKQRRGAGRPPHSTGGNHDGVVHDGFEPGSAVLSSVSVGWPLLLSSLKTLLETGEVLPAAAAR